MQNAVFAQPVINSFSPQAALPSLQVTISGSGFSSINDSNTVYFGAVKAVVNTSAANQLMVTVPVNASYAPLSVTSGGLTGYSRLAFNPATTISINQFDSTSFESPMIIPTSNTDAKWTIQLYDIDDDNKQDIICADSNTTKISIIKNISQKGIINTSSFANEMIQAEPGAWGRLIANPTDFDGDRKKDFACVNYPEIEIFKNQSNINTLQFEVTSVWDDRISSALAVADFDGDGKPDMVAGKWVCCSQSSIKVIRNTTSLYGALSFDTLPSIQSTNMFNHFTAFATADINGDNKPDLVYILEGNDSIFIRINTSVPGNISFAERVSIYATGTAKIITADMDSDNKPDIISITRSSFIDVFRNTSDANTVSFAPAVNLQTTNRNKDAVVSDFDGDGKPDIACAVNVGYSNQSFVALFKNNSTTGNIVFDTLVKYKVTSADGIAAGDIDGDGKQDIVVGCYYPAGKIAVLRNKTGETKVPLCVNNGFTTLGSSLSGGDYNWQMSTDSINFLPVTDNVNFSGSNTAYLVLMSIPSSWYGRQFRCMVNGKYDKIYTITFKAIWNGSIDSTWENPGNWSCNVLPDANTDVFIPSGTVMLGSNAPCRSIAVSLGANFSVLPGFILTITH